MNFLRSMLLRDDLDLNLAKKLQIRVRKAIEKKDFEKLTKLEEINNVIGVDISYFRKDNKDYGISCACIWEVKSRKSVEVVFSMSEINFPYKPGFLGFRESKLLAESIEKLTRKPQLIMCDGHGIIHPRKVGEAVQLGYALNIPSIGIPKNPFVGFGQWKKMERKKGNKKPIMSFSNVNQKKKLELLGYALCLNDDMKPVFISRGYKTSIKLAVKIALETTQNHRLPEPLFFADRYSREEIERVY